MRELPAGGGSLSGQVTGGFCATGEPEQGEVKESGSDRRKTLRSRGLREQIFPQARSPEQQGYGDAIRRGTVFSSVQ